MATVSKRTWETKAGKQSAWVLDFRDRQGKRHKEQFKLRKEADARRIEVEGQISKGAFRSEAAKKTVGDAIDAYAKELQAQEDKGQRTRMYVTNTAGQLRDHVRPTLGTVKLADLTARYVTDLIKLLEGKGVGLTTIRRTIGSLSRTLDYAVAQDMVAGNVAKGRRVEGKRGEGTEKVVPPTKEEFDAILKAADEFKQPRSLQPHALPLRVRFAARTGLRASEQWALKWSDLDLENASLVVSSRVDAFGKFDTTKSAAGQRTVRLSRKMVTDLKAWREVTRYKEDDDYLFPDARGGFTRHTNFVKRFWLPALKAAGVDTGWHSLRHFAVSTWIEAGYQPKQVQTLAGHATFHITMSRYGHMFPSEDDAAKMDQIDD
ncbi:site-specific integrase [Ensifer sp. ZNC0028]|uniref:tyrosine-type recombinase/integrase n=1 Tax=Ensifer sp. ZNC0028 TaxID=1339236 RepID=UPI0005B92BF8|nr:site-specific integrase [Ensifer sp. ZNC0028]